MSGDDYMNGDTVIDGAKNDAKNIIMLQHLNYIKLGAILKHCQSLPGDVVNCKVGAYVEGNPDGSCDIVLDENKIPLFEKQTFNELLVVSGVSVFEKCCKDWFAWGLKYSPVRLNSVGDRNITISEIIKSKDPKQTIMEKIINDINFQNAVICNSTFKKIFGVQVFESKEERYKFEKYLNHRHIVSHNCGYIDIHFTNKLGLTEEYVGTVAGLDDGELEDFLNLLYKITMGIAINVPLVIYRDLEKNTKKEWQLG